MNSVQFPFSVQTQTSKWKSSPSAIFLSYSNEWIWCYCQGSECKTYKFFHHFLGVCYFCSRSGLIRWTLDKMSKRKAKLMRKSFVELEWGFRPWLGSCIRALAQAGTRLRSWDDWPCMIAMTSLALASTGPSPALLLFSPCQGSGRLHVGATPAPQTLPLPSTLTCCSLRT